MNILITGITGFANRGVEALVVASVEELTRRMPAAQINVLSGTPQIDGARVSWPQVRFVPDVFACSQTSWSRRLRYMAANVLPGFASDVTQVRHLVKNASVVVASGGDVFGSDYGESLGAHLLPLQVAQRARVPVVFLAQSIGPFRKAEHARAWKKVADNAALITVREKRSRDYVCQDLQVDSHRVFHTADPAFLLKPSPPEVLSKLLAAYGLDPRGRRIALVPSQGISQYLGLDAQQHLEVLCELVIWLHRQCDAVVLLIPHVQRCEWGEDDRRLCTEIWRRLNNETSVRLIGGDHSAAELKALIGSCEMVVAERMHGAIAGLSSNRATAVIGYSVKAEGILADMFDDGETARQLLICGEELSERDKLFSRLEGIWTSRAAIGERLKHVCPELQQRAAENFKLLTGLILKDL
jgi:colanic acid/amylovoran biosynthesis protein